MDKNCRLYRPSEEARLDCVPATKRPLVIDGSNPQYTRPCRLDAYLDIAEKILKAQRRPLTSRQMIEYAYREGIAPPQLHGRTQHKTLGARLSVDILTHRERSSFFRTAPGRFFLREFLADETIPEKLRVPMIARRRQRELLRGKILAVPSSVKKEASGGTCIDTAEVTKALKKNSYRYVDSPKNTSSDEFSVWTFVMVTRGRTVLTYRHGRYKEDRDTFLKRRSIGFFTPVTDSDCGLFDIEDKGIVSAGLKAVILDLDLPFIGGSNNDYSEQARLECFLGVESPTGSGDLLGLLRFECPSWFEPLSRGLAINDLSWMDLVVPVNNIDDFDPWSQKVLEWAQSA